MNRKQKFILIFSIVLIAVAITLAVSLNFGGGGVKPGDEAGPSATGTETGDVSEPGGIPEFTEEVDRRAEETEADEVIDVVTDSEKDEKLGGYTITASRSGYSPDVLTVVQGNIVRLTLKAEDAKYDLVIPAMSVRLSAPEGEKKQTSFRVPQSGTFRFECQDFCPSGGPIYGQLIVKPRD